MPKNAIHIEEQPIDGGRSAKITFADNVRPLIVIKRGNQPSFLRLPRGTRAAAISRLDIDPSTARRFAGALIQGAQIAEEWDQ